MVMVPRNSTAEGFAYIRQSKRVMIAIKTERSQIHFLSDVLVAVVSLDLKVHFVNNAFDNRVDEEMSEMSSKRNIPCGQKKDSGKGGQKVSTNSDK